MSNSERGAGGGAGAVPLPGVSQPGDEWPNDLELAAIRRQLSQLPQLPFETAERGLCAEIRGYVNPVCPACGKRAVSYSKHISADVCAACAWTSEGDDDQEDELGEDQEAGMRLHLVRHEENEG